MCETIDGGHLREAAEAKNDEEILRHIRGKDCVAAEVRYHNHCYKKYVNFLNHTNADAKAPGDVMYTISHNLFCGQIVMERLLKKKEILYVTDLCKLFIQIVKDAEGLNASHYRPHRLKKRLQKSFPQLSFQMPFARSKSEIVFAEMLTSGELAERHEIVENYNYDLREESGDEHDVEDLYMKPSNQANNLLYLYTTSMTLRNLVQDVPPFSSKWPLDVSEITIENALEIVPVELFNFMALILGFSEEPCLDKRVPLSQESRVKVLSLCQDIIYISSKGKMQIPKHLSLAMAVRQITGSAKAIKLLNGFGHCVSYSSVLALDTAFATANLNNPSLVPKSEIAGNNNLLPGWTGFNTLLSKPKLVNSTIAYLPATNAPVTDYSTVKEVLKRSLEMADKLELNYMVLVFDEAVYAKIQHIRWMDSAYKSRFIVRLGEFHTLMFFCSAIAKRFQDAGLQVQYCNTQVGKNVLANYDFDVKVHLDIVISRPDISECGTYITIAIFKRT